VIVSLLQTVALRYHLRYVSLVNEIVADGSILCGVEIELPLMDVNYFWGHQLGQIKFPATNRQSMK
jgi:hypothetical protein